MHLIEAYSNHVGVKTPQQATPPKEQFYPIDGKYITIQASSGFESKNYLYYDKVVKYIEEPLKTLGVKIVQVGTSEDKDIGASLNLCGKTSFSQCCYVIKNTIGHIGNDSVWMHVANTYKKDIIGLFGSTLPNVSGPYFKNANIKILESHRNGKKASLSLHDTHNTINLIKPEEVANAIFELLGLDNKIKIKTTQVGKFNHIPLLEIDLSEKPSIQLKAINSLSLRLDWCDNLELAYSLINSLDCGVSLVIDKPTDLAFLNASKNKITQILYEINSIKDVDINYIKNLYSFGKTQIITDLENEDLNDLKFALFDYFSVASKLKHEPIKSEGLFFTNEGGVLKGDKKYPTKWHLDNEIYNESGEYEVPNTEEKSFWQYKEFLHFYQKTV